MIASRKDGLLDAVEVAPEQKERETPSLATPGQGRKIDTSLGVRREDYEALRVQNENLRRRLERNREQNKTLSEWVKRLKGQVETLRNGQEIPGSSPKNTRASRRDEPRPPAVRRMFAGGMTVGPRRKKRDGTECRRRGTVGIPRAGAAGRRACQGRHHPAQLLSEPYQLGPVSSDTEPVLNLLQHVSECTIQEHPTTS